MKLSKTIGIVAVITVLSVFLIALPGCRKAADNPTMEKPAEPEPASEPPIQEQPNDSLLFKKNTGDMYITEWNLTYEDPNTGWNMTFEDPNTERNLTYEDPNTEWNMDYEDPNY